MSEATADIEQENAGLLKVSTYQRKWLNGLWLKVLGFILTLLDHIGLLFEAQIGEVAYTILRCTGRCAFPIFVFLAVEGVYHTRCYWKYFLRLAVMAVILDAFCYGVYYGSDGGLGAQLTPGNVFTDLALGTLVVYLFRRNDPWTMLSILPIAYLVLSDFTVYRQGAGSSYAVIPAGIASDYGTYGLVMFILMYFAYQLAFRYQKYRAKQVGLDYSDIPGRNMRLTLNGFAAAAILITGCIFQIIAWTGFTALEPGIGWATESWSMLAIIPIMLYDGRPGVTNRPVRYSLYLFYPVHLILLWCITLAF